MNTLQYMIFATCLSHDSIHGDAFHWDPKNGPKWINAKNVDLSVLIYFSMKIKSGRKNNNLSKEIAVFTTSMFSNYLDKWPKIVDDRIVSIWLQANMFEVEYLLFPIFHINHFILIVVKVVDTKKVLVFN